MKFVVIALLVSLVSAIEKGDIVNQEYLEGYNHFVNNVYREFSKENPRNFVISPISVNIILALAEYGSKGETSKQLVKGLSLPQDKEKLREAMTSLTAKLNTNESYTLTSANKVYVKEGYQLKQNFKDFAVNVYHSEVEDVDFNKKEAAAKIINKWVEDKTVDKIKDLISKDDINDETRAILINALYFRGEWKNHFNKLNTKKETFYLNNKEQTEVNLMQVRNNFKYHENHELNAKFLELPYEGDDVTLTIALPNEKDGLANLESRLKEVLDSSHYKFELVNVKIPKDKIESKIQFKPILRQLGILDAFEDSAEFPEISQEKVKIDNVVQKALIEFDEEGTTAAAATAVLVGLTRSSIRPPAQPKQFIADHPFIFILKFRSVVLFIGHYTGK